MLQLTTAEATLLVAAIGLAGGLLAWLGRGLTFVLKRWWTGAPRQERATHLSTLADLAVKLRANGMTLDDVRQLESILHRPAIANRTAAKGGVEALAKDSVEPSAFISNVPLKARTSAAYDVSKSQLAQALMDLRLLIGDHEYAALEAAQERWSEYRRALEDCALREYEGGTNATLAMLVSGLRETERRTKEIRAQVADRSAR